MIHSPADIMAKLFIDLGYGTLPVAGSNVVWPIFSIREPDRPDDCITIFNTAGVQDGRSMIDGELQEHLAFQVRVRSKDSAEGWTKAKALQTAMAMSMTQRIVSIAASHYTVHCCSNIGQVAHIGTEPNSKRAVHTVNSLVSISSN